MVLEKLYTKPLINKHRSPISKKTKLQSPNIHDPLINSKSKFKPHFETLVSYPQPAHTQKQSYKILTKANICNIKSSAFKHTYITHACIQGVFVAHVRIFFLYTFYLMCGICYFAMRSKIRDNLTL